jgi:hypothetical protein
MPGQAQVAGEVHFVSSAMTQQSEKLVSYQNYSRRAKEIRTGNTVYLTTPVFHEQPMDMEVWAPVGAE